MRNRSEYEGIETGGLTRRDVLAGGLGALAGLAAGIVGTLSFTGRRSNSSNLRKELRPKIETENNIPLPADREQFVTISNEDITAQLKKLPEVWEHIIRDNYTTGGIQRDVHFRREWRFDPFGLDLEVGSYQVGKGIIVVPSVWSPMPSEGTFARSPLGRQIAEAVPHEVGHFILEDLARNPLYKGPSREDIARVLQPTVESLRERHMEGFVEWRKACARMPELPLYKSIANAFEKEALDGNDRTQDFEFSYNDIQREGSAELKQQANQIYAEAKKIRDSLLAEASKGNKIIQRFVARAADSREVYGFFNVGLLGRFGQGSEAMRVYDIQMSELWHKIPSKENLVMLSTTGVQGYSPRQLLDAATAQKLQVSELRARPGATLTSEQEKYAESKARERFTLGEVFANSVQGLLIPIYREASHEIISPSNELLPLLADMKYGRDQLLAQNVAEYESGRGKWFSEQAKKNKLNVRGDISYIN